MVRSSAGALGATDGSVGVREIARQRGLIGSHGCRERLLREMCVSRVLVCCFRCVTPMAKDGYA
jgi:hypothetical protein